MNDSHDLDAAADPERDNEAETWLGEQVRLMALEEGLGLSLPAVSDLRRRRSSRAT